MQFLFKYIPLCDFIALLLFTYDLYIGMYKRKLFFDFRFTMASHSLYFSGWEKWT